MRPLAFLNPLTTPSFVQRPVVARTCVRRPVFVITPRMGMSVKSEVLPNSQLGLEISVGKEECSAAWDSIVTELSKKSEMKGFRKGKVPKQVIISRYGRDTILASACEEVLEKSINKAIKDGEISAIGQAQVDSEGGVEELIKQFSPETPLTFKVKIDVWPEAEFISPYENLEVEAEEAVVGEHLVEKALEDLRKKESFSVLSGADEKVSMGKLVIADLTGYYREEDGSRGKKLPEIADGDAVEVEMKEGQYMAGFVEGMVGMATNEVRDVSVEFPQKNPRPELAGLKAIFEVKVNAIKDIVLPELNDDFAQQVSEEKTMDGLKTVIRARLGTEAESAQEKNINKSLDDELSSIVKVDLPATLVENQCKNKFAKMLASFQDKGMSDEQVKAMVTPENFELYKKQAQPNVERTLRINFAVSKIAKDQNIEVNSEEVEDQMTLVRSEMKGQEFDEAQARDQVESELEHDLVLEFLKQSAKVTLVPKKEEEEEEKETASAAAQ